MHRAFGLTPYIPIFTARESNVLEKSPKISCLKSTQTSRRKKERLRRKPLLRHSLMLRSTLGLKRPVPFFPVKLKKCSQVVNLQAFKHK